MAHSSRQSAPPGRESDRKTYVRLDATLVPSERKVPLTWSRVDLDYKNISRLEQYAGEKEQIQNFKWQLYIAVLVLSPDLLSRLEHVDKNMD